jgi:predicted O-methyltransferase YrrM
VLIESFRQSARHYRENHVLKRSDPGFSAALDLASRVEGFTAPVELSLLYHLACAPVKGRIVEIGSYLGRSTVILASAAARQEREPVVAVDPHTAALGIEGEQPRDTRAEFLSNLERASLASHVQLLHKTSAEAAREWKGDPVRLLFVDGWHSREAVLEDARGWAPFLVGDACVVFDDFLPFPGVRSAVRELRSKGVLAGRSLIVGKMVAHGPEWLMRSVPAPPGARLVSRLGDRPLDLAIKLLATQSAESGDG